MNFMLAYQNEKFVLVKDQWQACQPLSFCLRKESHFRQINLDTTKLQFSEYRPQP